MYFVPQPMLPAKATNLSFHVIVIILSPVTHLYFQAGAPLATTSILLGMKGL